MSAVDALLAGGPPPIPTDPPPTDEQQLILDAFAAGEDLAVEAGAGTGKTTTLTMVAGTTNRPGRYLAFNKSIATEAGRKMPRNITASTAHSLAYRAMVGPDLRERLSGGRMRSGEIARHLGIEAATVDAPWGRKHLAPWQLAGMVMAAVTQFCRTADLEPGPQHVVPLDALPSSANRQLAEQLAPHVAAAWADLCDPDGVLPYRHEHYLKAYQLTDPRIEADFILFDEAQDANPVMAAIVAAQTHAQVVVVGDTAQQIYAWNGAVNALAHFEVDRRLWLTQSWRFGPAVATVANRILTAAGLELRLQGHPGRDSTVEALHDDQVDAVLVRTNARAVVEIFDALDADRRPALVGGGTEVLAFARAAADLQDGKRTTHPELACFDTWAEVLDYVEDDAQGHELALLASLVVRFGSRTLIGVLSNELVAERVADVTISTAHKAKGREWPRVRLAGDLEVEPDDETGLYSMDELRLLYVAATRATDVLDLADVQLPTTPEVLR